MNTRTTTMQHVQNTAGRNTLRYIREIAGIDFQKPVIMLENKGVFTITQIWKQIPHVVYDYNVVVILSRNDRQFEETYDRDTWYNRFYIVKITGGDTNAYVTELNSKTYFDFKTKPDTFCRKSDFNEVRKTDTCYSFIIAQRKDYSVTPRIRERYSSNKYELKDNERYTNIKPGVTCYGNPPYRKIITEFDVTEKNGSGERHTINVPYIPSDDRYTLVETFFDKSGYYVQRQRDNLKMKAANLRADREKAVYDKTDFSDVLEKLRIKYIFTRGNVAQKLIDCETYNDFKVIDDVVTHLRWLSMDIDCFIEGINNKTFKSVSQVNDKYNKIVEKLNATIVAATNGGY